MKIRSCFVSNSSSASFVASLAKLSERDLQILLNYNEKSAGPPETDKYYDRWDINVDEHRGVVHGFTSMDNGDLSEYLEEHKVDNSLFVWDGE